MRGDHVVFPKIVCPGKSGALLQRQDAHQYEPCKDMNIVEASKSETVMDRAFVADRRLDAARQTKFHFSLPLVSVIIVNYNYGRYLLEAATSVFAQTYSNIELIIADDASTDESGTVLDGIAAAHPDTKIIRSEKNGGQSVASRQGFEASSGEYIVFLDADDVLLPDFVEAHVFIHLSLRIPVGMSSSDMAQAAGSRLVLSTVHYFSDYIRSGKGKQAELIRRIDENAPELWPLPGFDADLGNRVHLVPIGHQEPWIWAPTSGNCFRREALSMFFNNDALTNLRSCTDAYLIRGVSVLTGSVLIDRPLSIYRLHGVNVFSQHPHLNGFLNYDRSSVNNNDQKARYLLIDHLIADADAFMRKVPSSFHFLGALKALSDSWPRMPSKVAGCRTYLGGEVVKNFAQLSQAVGFWPLLVWTSLLGVAPWTLVGASIRSLARRKK
jgi:glycosyltransferase involved in cell wall biosynthesis